MKAIAHCHRRLRRRVGDFSFLSFSTRVVRLRFSKVAALFLTQPVFSQRFDEKFLLKIFHQFFQVDTFIGDAYMEGLL